MSVKIKWMGRDHIFYKISKKQIFQDNLVKGYWVRLKGRKTVELGTGY